MPIDVVSVRPELRRQAAELFAAATGRDVATAERYLEWRFERAPHAHGTTLWLALDADRVVGMRGCYPTLWALPSSRERLVLPCFAGVVVAPGSASDRVAGGIMVGALEELRAHGHRFVIDLGAAAVSNGYPGGGGWRGVGRATVLRLAPGPSAPAADPFAALDDAAATERAASDDVVAALSSRRSQQRIVETCDARHLGWLLDDPVHAHRVVASRSGGRITACLVLRGTPARSGVAVVDWYAESPTGLARLLGEVAHAGRWPELAVWAGPGERRELDPFLRAGFVLDALPQAAALRIRPTVAVGAGEWRLGATDLLSAATWDVRLLQSPCGVVPGARDARAARVPARAPRRRAAQGV